MGWIVGRGKDAGYALHPDPVNRITDKDDVFCALFGISQDKHTTQHCWANYPPTFNWELVFIGIRDPFITYY